MGKKQSREFNLLFLKPGLLSLGASLLLLGCAGAPNLEDTGALNATGGLGNGENANDIDADGNRDFTNPNQDPKNPVVEACKPGTIDQSFDIKPSSIRGANIVFLIDDSGSMSGEIQKVISQVGNFLGGINSATNENYRVSLVYNHLYSNSAFYNKTFYDQNGNQISSLNPLTPYIDASAGKVKHVQSITWSKWSDIAFFKAFAQKDYDQAVTDPAMLPEDSTEFRTLTNRPVETSYSNCSGIGLWFRPRFMNFVNQNDGGTLGCFTSDIAKASAGIDSTNIRNLKIEDYLLKNVSVNFIALSDDDLNVNFTGRINQLENINSVVWDDAKPQYPENVLRMLRQVLKPIGSDVPILYHSIIGLNKSAGGIDEVGHAHWALSKKTGGAIHDITSASYADAFNKISKKVIFSEQVVNLSCAIPSGTNPVIKMAGQPLSASTYTVTNNGKDIRLLPSAFSAEDEAKTIKVEVFY